MSVLATTFRKYWILLIVLLWVIAWANRDWLAGGMAGSPVTAPAEIGQSTVPGPLSSEARRDRSVSDAGPSDDHGKAVVEGAIASGDASATASVAAQTREPAHSSNDPIAMSVGSAPEPSTQVGDQDIEPTPAAVGEDLRASAAPLASEPISTDTVSVPPSRVAVPAPTSLTLSTLQARVRDVHRRQGIPAAIRTLEQIVADLPADASIRADALGELGNLYFANRQPTEALQAFDRALLVLPADERGTMIERLAPVYDRFHPAGRAHLQQFR